MNQFKMNQFKMKKVTSRIEVVSRADRIILRGGLMHDGFESPAKIRHNRKYG
jgi:hypothetical protein